MISILLAVYNGEKFIDHAIESVLNQTYTEWELLIGLNGTTDLSRSIVIEYQKKDHRIISFDYLSDKGKGKTLNKLINLSKYNWIAIQDDDDIWTKDKLEIQQKYIMNYDVIGSFINYIDSNGNFLGAPQLSTKDEDIKRLSFTGINQIANTSTIFKKNKALEIGGWRSDIDGIEDYDFWLRLMKNNNRFINIDQVLVYHRLHSGSNFNNKQHNLKKIL
jgi:glycosyltransferase involved in cell wall biosynthesis